MSTPRVSGAIALLLQKDPFFFYKCGGKNAAAGILFGSRISKKPPGMGKNWTFKKFLHSKQTWHQKHKVQGFKQL